MDLEIKVSSTPSAEAMVKYHEQLAEQWRAVARKGRAAHRADFPVDVVWRTPGRERPAHRVDVESDLLADLEFGLETPEEARIDLGRFLVEEKMWPAAFAARNVHLFAAAVKRRYVEARGEEPEWDRGDVYRGYPDFLIVLDTYEQEMGALAELIAFEGPAR